MDSFWSSVSHLLVVGARLLLNMTILSGVKRLKQMARREDKRFRRGVLDALTHPHGRQGFQNDFEVEPERPVFDVKKVELHHLLERELITSADLP
jgi:hypothetical protein